MDYTRDTEDDSDWTCHERSSSHMVAPLVSTPSM
ncbi:hypothetical protein A2U01_0099347, partial [Trifolium medium]|nr:hypothetical protein [Trifolium medium]